MDEDAESAVLPPPVAPPPLVAPPPPAEQPPAAAQQSAQPPPVLLPTPASSFASAPVEPDGFEDFMELGNAGQPAEGESTPASSQPAGESQGPEPAAEGPAGDQSRSHAPRPSTRPSSHLPTSPINPVSFLTGLFSKATTTIESTLTHAGHEVASAGSDVLSAATENISAAGSTALTSVTGLVVELTGGAPPVEAPARFPSTTTAQNPEQTDAGALLLARNRAGYTLVAAASSLFLFRGNLRRVATLNITWSEDGSQAVSTPPPPSAPSRSRGSPGKPVVALCAAYLGETDEVLTGHEDGALRLFSAEHERLGIAVRATAPEEAIPVCAQVVPRRPLRVATGWSDGSVRLVDVARLDVLAVFHPPDLCSATLGVSFRYAPVACLSAVNCESGIGMMNGIEKSEQLRLFAGYEDGAIAVSGAVGQVVGEPFIAQSRAVSALCGFFDGVIVISIGNDTDTSLSAFDSLTGRCFVRRMLPYVPTSLSRVPMLSSQSLPAALTESVCPSENAFIVGGEDGQVEIFRVVVLSPKKLELRLVRRISERIRGRDRGVVQAFYRRDEAVLLVVSKNGELRRWRLNAVEASSLSLLPWDTRNPTYTEENIVEKMATEFATVEDARVSSVGGVIQAQNVLAAILDEDAVSEGNKDQLVQEFQKLQAEMLVKISQRDTELRRAGRRISSRFAAGLNTEFASISSTERRLIRAAKRTAAFEIEYATRRHAETIEDIQSGTLAQLKALLLGCLKGLRASNANGLDQIRIDAEELRVEEAAD